MLEMLNDIASSILFTNDSPFRMSIQPGNGKLIVITGDNCSGKSLLRKLLHCDYDDNKIKFMHFSQAGRSRSGIERQFIYGTEEDDSTGHNSVKLINRLFRYLSNDEPTAVLLDEPEIGCSEELQLSIGNYLLDNMEAINNTVAFYVITHSRLIASRLLTVNPTHVRMGSELTLKQYCEREVIPADLESFANRNSVGWSFLHGKKKR